MTYTVVVLGMGYWNVGLLLGCTGVCVVLVMEAVVLFDYEKQQEDELDLTVGMTISNVIQVLGGGACPEG